MAQQEQWPEVVLYRKTTFMGYAGLRGRPTTSERSVRGESESETYVPKSAAPPSQVGGLADEDQQALLRAALVCSNPHNWAAQLNVAGRLRKLAASAQPISGLLGKLEAEVRERFFSALEAAGWSSGEEIPMDEVEAVFAAILDSERKP